MEDLNYLILGPLNEHRPNWQGLKAYGLVDLLIRCTEQGNKVYLVGGTIFYFFILSNFSDKCHKDWPERH